MNTKEINQLNAAKVAIKDAWDHACQFDGVPFDSSFVVFSPNNIAAILHNDLLLAFMKLRNRIAHNVNRRERHATLVSLGLKRVKGNLGGTYYE